MRQTDVISGLVYANAQGEFQAATASHIATTLGAGNYIQNQSSSAQVASSWINGVQTALAVQAYVSNTIGYSIIQAGTTSQAGYLGIYNSNQVRLGYIGWHNSHINYAAENGANHVFTGNVALGGAGSANAALQFGNITSNRKIVLYEDANNDHEFYGLGINASMLRYQVRGGIAVHAFFASNSSSSSIEIMRMVGDGKVLIGTTSPNGTWRVQINSGSATDNGLYVNGHIRATGNIIADGYFSGTSSDRRYKSEFRPITVIDKIDKLEVNSYQHKLYGRRMIGSIAQDIEQLFPELVYQDDNKMYRLYDNGYAAIALQLGKEIKSEVDILKERVKELEIKLQLLENK